jgi:predicted ATPase
MSNLIAQIGAAIGREFSYRLLAAVAPGGSLPLNTALAHLAACELIFVRGEPPDSTYIFKHALVQDAAYATITRASANYFTAELPTRSWRVSPRPSKCNPS